MILSLIAALSENGVIGNAGIIPWRLSTDMKRFKTLTTGHHMIMGRKTLETFRRTPEAPITLLPGRTHIVITRNSDYRAPDGCLVAHSIAHALSLINPDDETETFFIGGGDIYKDALPLVSRMYLTHVHTTCIGDAVFPKFDPVVWKKTPPQHFPPDEKNQFASTYIVYERM